jgi:hypothetical protein
MAITVADLQDRYDDANLACIVQPVKWSTPWATLPQAAQFRTASTRRSVPQIDWVIEMWEADIRTALTTWMKTSQNIDLGNRLQNLPANFISFLYRNLFTNVRDENSSVFMTRLDHELTGATHAAPAYWVGYYLAGYLMAQYATGTDNESQYRYKQLSDLQEVIGTAMANLLTQSPTLTRDQHVMAANTQSVGDRQTMFVDADRLVTYLNSGKTIDALATGWLLNEINPTV